MTSLYQQREDLAALDKEQKTMEKTVCIFVQHMYLIMGLSVCNIYVLEASVN